MSRSAELARFVRDRAGAEPGSLGHIAGEVERAAKLERVLRRSLRDLD